ncbi:MAG: hypothetical protein DRJ10_15185 [Bacteroidetes bacterium]|nr:MAG: hypothetical protein DRJ10_15185 [Bacteroidota bacterium]
MKKVQLNIESLVYSQTQSGAYVLVLIEEKGNRKLPIVIGSAEAQAIAIALEGMSPPRPLTHDLFVNFASAFNINLDEVLITKLEEGIFYSELICDSLANRVKIDSRTSDAVALAIRFKCPIYADEEVLKQAGISSTDFSSEDITLEEEVIIKEEDHELNLKSLKDLKKMLSEAINNEEYESASRIRDEINRRE